MNKNFIRTTRLKFLKEEEKIKNILRLRSLKTKNQITMIYISLNIYLQKEMTWILSVIFCDVIGCSIRV